jgi:hypothetical protein
MDGSMKGRQLKVFHAHLGFYDTVVAAPSQKAALEAWGAGASEFAKGFARLATDPKAVRKALAEPGKVLRRPFGTKGEYKLVSGAVPAQKLPPKRAKRAADVAKQEKRHQAAARKAAERELKDAQQTKIRELAELRKREADLVEEKAAARQRAQKRIERAKSRLAGSKGNLK